MIRSEGIQEQPTSEVRDISVGVRVFRRYEAWNAVSFCMKLRKDLASREQGAGLSDDHTVKTAVVEDVTRLFVG